MAIILFAMWREECAQPGDKFYNFEMAIRSLWMFATLAVIAVGC